MPDAHKKPIAAGNPALYLTGRKLLQQVFLCLAFLGLLIWISACAGTAAETGTANPNPSDSEINSSVCPAEVNNGNLHYQNLVFQVSDQIYFCIGNSQIGKSMPDGSMKQVLVDSAGSSFTSDGNWLFYSEGTQAGNLCKVGLDGDNQVRIGSTPLKYLLCADNRLYAIEADNGLPVSFKTDGTNRVLLADCQAVALNLADGVLYISGSEQANGLLACNLASGSQECLIDRQISSLNVCGEWLYFADPQDQFHVYAWSLNQKTGWQISQLNLEKPFIVSGGFLYYIQQTEQNRLYRLPVNGRQNLDQLNPELIVDDAVESFVLLGSRIYYQRPDSSRIYQVSAEGGAVQRIS